jgi:diguanylate cyclase (GGDEF)-like protein
MTTAEIEKRSEAATARLLVVDDEEEVLRIFREFLTDEGHEVVGCFNGAQACERIRTGDFDLVITDMVMSPVPGEEVLRYVAEHSPGTEVIVITAFATFERLQEALRRQVFGFVEKPVDLPELGRTVREALERARAKKEKCRRMDELQAKNHRLMDEVRRATANLAPDALEDPGTGLPGYQAFRSVLEMEISRSLQTRAPLTLGMVHVGSPEDTGGPAGREGGDAFLREVGQFLQASTRREDIVFRYGEHQFAVVFPASGSTGVRRCLKRLMARASDRAWKGGDGARDLEFAAGLASLPADAGNFDDLVAAADRALESAKQDPGERVRRA